MIQPNVKVILFKGKTLVDNSHPVMLQVKLGTNKYKRFSLGYSADRREWNDTDGRYRDNVTHKLDNRDLLELEEKARDLVKKMFDEARELREDFNFQLFKARFLGKETKEHERPSQLLPFLEWYIDYLVSKNRLGDAGGYKALLSIFKDYGFKDKLKLQDVNKDWLEDLERKLIKRKNLHTGELIKGTSVFSHFKRLRTLFNKAIYFDVMNHYPFKNSANPKGYTFSHLTSPRINKTMSDEELEKFICFDWENAHRKMKKAWLIGYFIYMFRGIPISDAALLKTTDISNNQLQFGRIKTKKKVPNIPINKERQWIIDQLKPYTDGIHIVPILFKDRHKTEQSKRNRINKIKTWVNTGLKMIAAKQGIEQNLHTYIFRHTFARKVLEKHGIWHLKETLGHASVTTTQSYAASLSSKELEVVDDVY